MIARTTPHTCVAELSLADLIPALDGAFTHPENANHFANCCGRDRWDDCMRHESSWYGGLKSLAEATALLDQGWRSGAERIERATAGVQVENAKSRKRVRSWGSEGDDLHVGRAMAGEWDTAWSTTRREWAPGNTHVTLYGQLGGNANRTEDQMFWSGAALLVTADRLEAAGYSVRIVASRVIASNSGDRRAMRADVIVKEAEEPLRVDSLASVVCHPGVFRTYGFAAMCAVPGNIGDGLGRAASFAQHQRQFEQGGEWPEGAVVVDDAYSAEACVTAVRTAIARATGTVI